MTKIIKVVDSEEDFKVFNQSSPIKSPHTSSTYLPSAQLSDVQKSSDILEAMVLQRKQNTSLLELLESHTRGSTP